MSLNLETLLEFFSSPTFETVKLVVILYIGLLWLSIIIWVTRDAISRSDSLFFQVFSILINIIMPILGVVLYLIMRPGQTLLEKYYEELEHRLIIEKSGDEAVKEAPRPLRRTPKKPSKLIASDIKSEDELPSNL